jgi:hypothetical protein
MSQYMLLFRSCPSSMETVTEEQGDEIFQQFVNWSQKLQAAGKLRGVERLTDDRGKTVRKRSGGYVVDGPYCEAKDAVGGYFVVEAKDIQGAIEIAKGCPLLEFEGSVEVREVGDFPKP